MVMRAPPQRNDAFLQTRRNLVRTTDHKTLKALYFLQKRIMVPKAFGSLKHKISHPHIQLNSGEMHQEILRFRIH